ncbi:uncharacterized [Tachysurus ichikawai]
MRISVAPCWGGKQQQRRYGEGRLGGIGDRIDAPVLKTQRAERLLTEHQLMGLSRDTARTGSVFLFTKELTVLFIVRENTSQHASVSTVNNLVKAVNPHPRWRSFPLSGEFELEQQRFIFQ